MTIDEYRVEQEKAMSEYEHQKRLFEEVESLKTTHPELNYLYHIPNGEYRTKATAGKLRAMGVKAGIPDIHLPIARGSYHGLYIELKSLKRGAKTSDNQDGWIEALRDNGYCVGVCRGWREALRLILDYMEV